MLAAFLNWTADLDWTGIGILLLALGTVVLAWFTAQSVKQSASWRSVSGPSSCRSQTAMTHKVVGVRASLCGIPHAFEAAVVAHWSQRWKFYAESSVLCS